MLQNPIQSAASLVQQTTTLVAPLVQNTTLVTLQFSEQRRPHKATAKDLPPSSLNFLAECIRGTFLHMVYTSLLSLLSLSTFFASQQFTRFSNCASLTDQALLIHFSVENFLTMRHVFIVTVFFIRIQTAVRSLSSFKLSCNLFGIIPPVDITNSII
jgi:hypothetical protein